MKILTRHAARNPVSISEPKVSRATPEQMISVVQLMFKVLLTLFFRIAKRLTKEKMMTNTDTTPVKPENSIISRLASPSSSVALANLAIVNSNPNIL